MWIEGEGLPTHYNVLFLCTGNSARSILAEAILNAKGKPAFTAYSAGSHPSGAVRPEAIQALRAAHIATEGLRSKSWDEFAQPGAPKLDFVFTVCDNAANEVCPVFSANPPSTGEDARASMPVRAHWGVADPAAVQGSPREIERAFRDAFTILQRRIDLFLALPLDSIERMTLKRELDRIGTQS
jgi:arsenate reductase (thioredoxin)